MPSVHSFAFLFHVKLGVMKRSRSFCSVNDGNSPLLNWADKFHLRFDNLHFTCICCNRLIKTPLNEFSSSVDQVDFIQSNQP